MKENLHILTLLCAVSIGLVTFSCAPSHDRTGEDPLTHTKPAPFTAKDTTWKTMTLREKIGQTMIMLPDREKQREIGGGSLEGFFEKYPVGGFFMGWMLFKDVAWEDRAEVQQKAVEEYAKASKYPLFFQQDYERGAGGGNTPMPTEMALGATDSAKLAYDYGKSVALEARSVGVSWMLHPVADLGVNPFNPIVNVRGISDDPDKAIRLLSQQIKGIQDQKVAATIKHFPGDGMDYRDQHLVATTNSLSMEAWQQQHGKVFQALIDSGVACIMPGHITLPAYQKEKVNGFYPPATLSKELLTDLLKGEMNFNGAIVSDAMVMGGFRGWYSPMIEAEIKSFEAGVDIMLWPSYAFMDTLEARIIRGEIPMSRLDDAVSRAWAMKERVGLLGNDFEHIRPLKPAEQGLAKKIASAVSQKALTLVRDRNQQIPLDPKADKNVLLIKVANEGRKGGSGEINALDNFGEELRKRGFEVDTQHNLLYESQGWTEDVSTQYDKIIVALARRPHAPFGPIQLWDDEAQTAWGVNAMPKDNLIVISFGSPYHINEYFERVNTCINAYANTPMMHQAVTGALLGEFEMTGISPVDLEVEIIVGKK